MNTCIKRVVAKCPHQATSTPPRRNAAKRSGEDFCLGVDVDAPPRIEQALDDDKRHRRIQRAEELTVSAACSIPIGHIGHIDVGPHDILAGTPQGLHGLEDDLKTPRRLLVGSTGIVSPRSSRGAVPETTMREPRRTARENPTRLSYGEAERYRRVSEEFSVFSTMSPL